MRRRSYVGWLTVRYVFDRDITERYRLSVYALSISARVGIFIDGVVPVGAVSVVFVIVGGTIAEAAIGSLTKVRVIHGKRLFPERVI